MQKYNKMIRNINKSIKILMFDCNAIVIKHQQMYINVDV